MQNGGDLLVREAVGSERGKPRFGRRKAGRGGATPADACQLVPGPISPQAGAEAVEDPVRVLERLPRRALLPRPTSDRSERQQRTAALERTPHASVLGERLFERITC